MVLEDYRVRIGVSIVLIILGTGLLMFGGITFQASWGGDYLSPSKNDQARYQYSFEQVPQPAESDSRVAEVNELPPVAQEAFKDARYSGRSTLWEEDDGDAVVALNRYEYVEYDGEYYEIRTIIGDPPHGLSILGIGFIVLLGLASIIGGSRLIPSLNKF